MIYGTLCYVYNHNDGKVLVLEKPIIQDDPNSGMDTIPGGKLEDYEIRDPSGILKIFI